MNNKQFTREVLARKSDKYHPLFSNDLLHAAIGIATESGELLDALKKNAFYGKSLDKINLQEELGDLLWYIALAAHDLGTTIDELMVQNTKKLTQRYGPAFNSRKAIERVLSLERAVLVKYAPKYDQLEPSKVPLSSPSVKVNIRLEGRPKRIRNKSPKH